MLFLRITVSIGVQNTQDSSQETRILLYIVELVFLALLGNSISEDVISIKSCLGDKTSTIAVSHIHTKLWNSTVNNYPKPKDFLINAKIVELEPTGCQRNRHLGKYYHNLMWILRTIWGRDIHKKLESRGSM